jgi:hypothetical protein
VDFDAFWTGVKKSIEQYFAGREPDELLNDKVRQQAVIWWVVGPPKASGPRPSGSK